MHRASTACAQGVQVSYSTSPAGCRLGRATRFTSPRRGIKNTRDITKRDRVLNDYLPVLEVDSETYEVRADGMLLTCEPAKVLPLAQRYFLF